MLITAKKIQELSFGALMKVYVEDCLERGRWLSPEETGDRQIAVGEQEFYQYLNEVFFRTPDAVYAVWEEKGADAHIKKKPEVDSPEDTLPYGRGVFYQRGDIIVKPGGACDSARPAQERIRQETDSGCAGSDRPDPDLFPCG